VVKAFQRNPVFAENDKGRRPGVEAQNKALRAGAQNVMLIAQKLPDPKMQQTLLWQRIVCHFDFIQIPSIDRSHRRR